MAAINHADVQLGRIVADNPSAGVVAALNNSAVVTNLVSWDPTTNIITLGGSGGSASLALGGGLRQFGTVVARFENTAITRPGSSTGIGLELGASIIQSYNNTSAAFAPLQFNASSFAFNAGATITTTSGVQPLAAVGINAFSRFSRNEAAFVGALVQFDRSGVVAGYVGMDTSDNLTIQRGADAAVAVTVSRTSGVVTLASGLAVAAGTSIFMAAGQEQLITDAGASGSTALVFKRWNGAGYVEQGRFAGGVFAWGTTVTTGAGPGNIVLPNGIGYCSANAAGNSILALLNADSSNRTVLRMNGVRLVFATALTSASAPSNGTASAPPTNPYAYLLANIGGQDVGVPLYIL